MSCSNSSSTKSSSSLSEGLDADRVNHMLTDLDGASVLSPVPINSSEPTTEAMLMASLFDMQHGEEDPDQPVSYELINGESEFTWPEEIDSVDRQPLNSAAVSNVLPETWLPVVDADDSWMYDYESSKDEIYGSDSKAAPSMIGAGLANLGNTCFLNSIMQCFTHTVPLVDGLLSCSHPLTDGHNGYCVICAFRFQMQHSLQSTGKVISPVILVDNLSHFSSVFRRHQQEDAHEFMQCALDKLDSCFLTLKKNDPSFEGENIVNKVFGGSLVSKLQCCNCGRSSDTNEPLIDLSLEIENVDSLSSALESFTMVENIDEKFKCEGCNEEVSMEKQLMLDQTPSIAAFHLKRFKTDGIFVEKIDKHIDIPLELDLQPYTILNENNNVSLKYYLYAVVVHTGISSHSGHYFCFVRTAPDTWHKLDDSKVTKVSEKTVLSQEAYILFYARQGTLWFSTFAESMIPCLDLNRMNTSPKSVLDVTDGQDKSFPILNENVEKSEAGESKQISEKKFDYSSRKNREFLGIDDVDDSPCREQFTAGRSNQKTLNVKGLEDINSKVLPLNSASLTGTAKPGGSLYADHSAHDKNNSSLSVFDLIENDIFNPLTPPNTPPYQTPGKSFQISRDHLNTENQGSSKRSSSNKSNKSNKSTDSPGKKAAMTYLKKMPGSRRGAFMDLVNGCHNKTSPENKRKNTDSLLTDKGNKSARKKSSHASIGGYPVAAGISQ